MSRSGGRTWRWVCLAAVAATLLYPPWRFGIAAAPPPGTDVSVCTRTRAFAPLWSPPTVGGSPNGSVASLVCARAELDLRTLGLLWFGVALAGLTGGMLAPE